MELDMVAVMEVDKVADKMRDGHRGWLIGSKLFKSKICLSVCLFVCLYFEILNIGTSYHPRVTSGQTPHIIHCRQGMRSHTNTKTKTRTKTNTKIKCFKGSLYDIFLKSIGFKDFKFCIVYHLVLAMTHTNTKTKCFKDPRYAIFFKSSGFKDIK